MKIILIENRLWHLWKTVEGVQLFLLLLLLQPFLLHYLIPLVLLSWTSSYCPQRTLSLQCLMHSACDFPTFTPWFCHNIKGPLTKLSLSLILYLWYSVACRFALNPQDSCNEWSCNLYQLHCCCCFAFILVLDLLLWGLWRRYPLVWNAP